MTHTHSTSYKDATGEIQFNFTNDYMFRYILQQNKAVLKGLVCSMLHLKPEVIKDLEITNPINLSENMDNKEFILDINILLNNNELINLEMQNANQYNWQDRSLMYLCRAFDQLSKGQDYQTALPVTHIGFLDFTLFPDEPEFYATNMMLNIKTHQIFNSKFKLSVLDLSQIELATAEDSEWEIDYWARLFKAKLWEDLKMLVEKNEALQEAAQALYVANADEIVRQKCLAREEAERHERVMKRRIQTLETTIDKQAQQLDEQARIIAELKQRLAETENK